MTGNEVAETIKFSVRGSSPEPYVVTFQRKGKNLSAYCTCPSGRNGGVCKHRTEIFEGATEGIVSDNAEKVTEIVSWLPGTDVGDALIALAEAERDLAHAKKRHAQAKLELIATLRD